MQRGKGTVLFVSHDTGAITNFCDRVLWIEEGKNYREGPPDEILENYLISQVIADCHDINISLINGYIRTLAGYTYKTVEQNICSIPLISAIPL